MRKSDTDVQSENSDARARQLAGLKPFKPGQSGNPKGRPKQALYSDALRRKLSDVDETDELKRTYAEILAEQAILKAKGGDIHALAHVADRTEGKPRQTITLTLEQREQYERAVAGMIAETGCSREAAIQTLSIFKPEVSELLN
ncbi:MAG: hypothetical protein H0W99_05670 [Acidobacteria bacterium]|nr:hypothetical protein [Acidobacteriota bacterium]